MLVDVLLFAARNSQQKARAYHHQKFCRHDNSTLCGKFIVYLLLNYGILKYMSSLRIWGLVLSLFFLLNHAEAQVKPKSREQQKKELRKKKERQIEKQRKAEERLKKRHVDIQDKATKKRMKKAKKKSDKLNRKKKRKRF